MASELESINESCPIHSASFGNIVPLVVLRLTTWNVLPLFSSGTSKFLDSLKTCTLSYVAKRVLIDYNEAICSYLDSSLEKNALFGFWNKLPVIALTTVDRNIFVPLGSCNTTVSPSIQIKRSGTSQDREQSCLTRTVDHDGNFCKSWLASLPFGEYECFEEKR